MPSKILRIATQGEFSMLEVSIYHSKGRGIVASATPGDIVNRGSYQSVITSPFDGVGKLIKPLARFSQKQLDMIDFTEDIVKQLVEYVADKNHLLIKTDENGAWLMAEPTTERAF